MDDVRLRLSRLAHAYRSGDARVEVLRDVDLSLQAGEVVALVAPSGAGKSTLLHLAGLLERPDAGEVYVLGRATMGMRDNERTALRRAAIGFVYQFHHLLREFSALENVILPQMIAGITSREAQERASVLLSGLGLGHRLHHTPSRLSGGEQQRVAIARALANNPALLLADEPTGNLDTHTADAVFQEMMKTLRDHNVAALIATHNPDLAARMSRRITLRNGRVEELP
ncbi:MAG: ABC transporter ATP-binding protein [Alphaproteobacteria bacterium]|nr:ABC transporter ATP-binding protein [Alphaproteobacteria bacterium]